MLKRRTILIYNLGIAVIFLLIGMLAIQAREFAQPTKFAEIPAFQLSVRDAIGAETDIEKLREKAQHYFSLSRDLKRARFDDTDRIYNDVRWLSFVVAALFAVGALITLVPPKKAKA